MCWRLLPIRRTASSGCLLAYLIFKFVPYNTIEVSRAQFAHLQESC